MCNREKRLHFIVIKYDCSDMTKDNIKQEEAEISFLNCKRIVYMSVDCLRMFTSPIYPILSQTLHSNKTLIMYLLHIKIG